MSERRYTGLGIDLVQSVLCDILKALVVLDTLGIVHTDVKPENILQKSITSQHVKLIDFGNAISADDAGADYAQTRFYRAPEVILILPLSTKSDVWSIGCVAAELFLGLPLLPGQNEEHQLYLINEMFGPFPPEMIDASRERDIYFHDDGTFRNAEEFLDSTGVDFRTVRRYFKQTKLADIVNAPPAVEIPQAHREQTAVKQAKLLDLLGKLLTVNPAERISAREALEHPFMKINFQEAS
jgi:dual specificity protein kinase YAK1